MGYCSIFCETTIGTLKSCVKLYCCTESIVVKKFFWKTTTHAYCVVVKKIYRKKVWHNIHDLNDNINSKYFFQLTYQKSYLVIKCSKKYLAIWVNILEMWISLVSLRRNKGVKTFSLLLTAKYFGLPMRPTNFTRTTSFMSNTWCMRLAWLAVASSEGLFHQKKTFNEKLWVMKIDY